MADSFSPTFEGMEELIGFEGAAKLCREFRGRFLFIPSNMTADNHIAKVVGLDKAEKISEAYGGSRWAVPVTLAKRIRVLELSKSGMAPARIAAEMFISQNYVYGVLRGDTEEKLDQLDLFRDLTTK